MARTKQAGAAELERIVELDGGRRVVLGEVLGKGASATVFGGVLESPSGVRHSVAVKRLLVTGSEELERVRTMLVKIASRVACVDHPNVVRVIDCGVYKRCPVLVTELVAGVSLASLQEAYASGGQRIPLDLALFIGLEVAEALSGASLARDHTGARLGILHHALSASDVLLSWNGEVKVTDFEVAAARSATSSVRSFHGIAQRMVATAPEVALGKEPDERSDVFSLGVLLRELFVGPRFPASVAADEALAFAREGFVQPLSFQPHLPPGLDALLERALAIDPAARYPSAAALASALRQIAFTLGVGDGRWFLRTALEHGWPAYDDLDEAEANVYDLSRRRRR